MLTNLLVGHKVRLTALDKKDIPTLMRWHQDTAYLRLQDSRPALPRTEATTAAWLDEVDQSKDGFTFAVRLLDNNALIGTAGLDEIEWPHQVGEFFIGIGERQNWRQGYGADASRLVLAYAFEELNLHRVQLTVFSYNEAAIALYEKMGFKREGVFRQFLQRDGQRDGQRHDMYLYGLLRPEWETALY
jgi:RimJ/RimL family protein N-acetyltransferase